MEKLIEVSIPKILGKGVKKYNKYEHYEIIPNIENMNVEYSPHNERPFAAFMTEYLVKNLNKKKKHKFIGFHELPIKGISDKEINKIKDLFIKNNHIDEKNVIKKYKSYNVDGYLKLKKLKNNFFNFFIEYKVNKNFKIIDLALDFLKFLIYSSRSKNEETFIYVVVFKDNSGFKSLNKKVYDLSQGLLNTSSINKKNIFVYKKPCVEKSTKNDMLSLQTKLVSLDKLNDMREEIPVKIEIEEYEKFSNSLDLKNAHIYGKNVLFSNKMKYNSKKIIQLQKDLESTIGKNADATNTYNFTEISNFIKKLKNTSVAKEIESDSKHQITNKMTNWILSLITFIAKEEKKEIDFEIKNVDALGNVSGDDSLCNGFQEMVKQSGELLKKCENYKTFIYKIIRHISCAYSLIYNQGKKVNEMPKEKEKYVSYKKLNSELKNIKDIWKVVLGSKWKNNNDILDILNFEKYTENFSKKMINKIFNIKK